MNGNDESSFRENDRHFATKATHVGQDSEQWNSMAIVPPITLATTFKQVSMLYRIRKCGRKGMQACSQFQLVSQL